jgi:hypothetical protein
VRIDVLEVEAAGFALKPLCGPYCTDSETAARKGLMTNLDDIVA